MTQAFPFPSTPSPSAAIRPDRVEFDNLLRRELKVSDPSNPVEVARALLDRYKAEPRALAIQQEAQGLPFLQMPTLAAAPQLQAQASDSEWKQAMDDVERDLQEVQTSSLLKDIQAELRGWGQAIRTALGEGDASARFALDARQRDKALGIRRQLSDYARLARLIGALTPGANFMYRQLARSLDEAAAVLLVRLGESLANAGYSNGRYLLQAPLSELQQRRDAVIYALRSLLGATQEAYGQNDWPRGLAAYRELFEQLEREGQSDLRALLVETELSRAMDQLLQRVADGTPEGLRAVGATAQVDLARFQRLILVGRNLVRPESPPLTAFLMALQLFVDGFQSSGGFRLLRIARPAILQYGLYGTSVSSPAESRLLRLSIFRNQLADTLDCLLACACSSQAIRMQIALDKVLNSMDRCIDLYCMGVNDFEEPECRASAHAFLLQAVRDQWPGALGGSTPSGPNAAAIVEASNRIATEIDLHILDRLHATLNALFDQLSPLAGGPDWSPPPNFQNEGFVGIREQELCADTRVQAEWQNLVQSLAPSCANNAELFGSSGLFALISEAAFQLNRTGSGSHVCETEPSLPPTLETLLDGLVHRVDADGTGRKTKGHLLP
ncbi:MAG: hypothetical protein QM756_35950 [Polyangiaceae bacterium]